MESKPESHIRESSRMLMQLNRRNIREEENDLRRCLGTTSSNSTAVTDIANKLKTKASVSAEELRTLKNALLDDGRHVETMLSTHGALRGLVREISGHEIRKQCEAVGCCCNLALAVRGSLSIAKNAGPYLVTGLDSQSTELAVNCAWALGNLAASSAEARELLAVQGALGKLLTAAVSGSVDVADAALYALGHFLYGMKEFRADHVAQLLQTPFVQHNLASSSHLLFMLSWDPSFSGKVSVEFLQKILDHFSVSMQTHLVETHRGGDCCHFKYLVRLLANMCAESSEKCSLVLGYFVENNFVLGFKRLLGGNGCEDVMWLLGNLFKYCDNEFYKNAFFSTLLCVEQ